MSEHLSSNSTFKPAAWARGGSRSSADFCAQVDADLIARPTIERRARLDTDRFVCRDATKASTTIVDSDAKSFVSPSVLRRLPSDHGSQIDAAVPDVWEGTVLDVDQENALMRVQLRSTRGIAEDHVGEIALSDVVPQDRDLIAPGAVFYLTVSRLRMRGGSFINADELRFRRLPAWTTEQLASARQLAQQLSGKIRAKPLAE